MRFYPPNLHFNALSITFLTVSEKCIVGEREIIQFHNTFLLDFAWCGDVGGGVISIPFENNDGLRMLSLPLAGC